MNCNAVVHGRFCSVCGQENLEPQESVGHLVSHFFQDVTHFDGKFFYSLKDILFKPGFLTAEYVRGRRASYLNPVRMYVFTSAIFFLIIFSLQKSDDIIKFDRKDDSTLVKPKFFPGMSHTDSQQVIRDVRQLNDQIIKLRTDSASRDNGFIGNSRYKTKEQYDDSIRLNKVNDNFIERQIQYQKFRLEKKYGKNQAALKEALSESIKHHIPQIFIISLPLLALCLKLLYLRRKKFYFVAHCIFLIHVYVFVYLAYLILMLIEKLSAIHGLSWLHYLTLAGVFGIVFYFYKAMRNFYDQGRLKTIAKMLLLFLWLLLVIVILFTGLFFFSIFNI